MSNHPYHWSIVNSLNDLNKNDFNKNAPDHKNDAALRPQQPLVPNQLSSASQINDVSTTQQKNSDNKHQNEQRKSNKDRDKNVHVSSIKSSIPCPFLIHRNRCVKGNRCDYKHPEKSSIPCPFLKKRGYCLKENKCDFSHDIPLDNDPCPRPYFGSHANADPFYLISKLRSMLRQINRNPTPTVLHSKLSFSGTLEKSACTSPKCRDRIPTSNVVTTTNLLPSSTFNGNPRPSLQLLLKDTYSYTKTQV